MASPLDNQLVRVRNNGDQPLAGAYGGNPYLIRPGEESFMEVECAKKDFGDWDTRNLSPTEEKLRFRTREYARVRGLYGVTPGAKIPVRKDDGSPELNENGVPQEVLADLVWKDRVPKVEVLKMDGTRIVTVLEDPEGKDLPAGDTPSEDKDLALAQMKAEIEKLQNSVASMQSQVSIPTDDPDTAPRPVAKKAKVASAQSVSSE